MDRETVPVDLEATVEEFIVELVLEGVLSRAVQGAIRFEPVCEDDTPIPELNFSDPEEGLSQYGRVRFFQLVNMETIQWLFNSSTVRKFSAQFIPKWFGCMGWTNLRV